MKPPMRTEFAIWIFPAIAAFAGLDWIMFGWR
jgi:hypothetical protein